MKPAVDKKRCRYTQGLPNHGHFHNSALYPGFATLCSSAFPNTFYNILISWNALWKTGWMDTGFWKHCLQSRSTGVWVASQKLADWRGNILKGYRAAYRITGKDEEPGWDASQPGSQPKAPTLHLAWLSQPPLLHTDYCTLPLHCPLEPDASNFTTDTESVTSSHSNPRTKVSDWPSQGHLLKE